MQNRSQAPEIKNFKAINFVKPSIKKLNENSNLYYFQDVPNDTSRIELYFNFGTITVKNGLASSMSSLLFSGSKTLESIDISISNAGEVIDILKRGSNFMRCKNRLLTE